MFPLESLSSFLYEVVFLFFWWAYITISDLICQYFFVYFLFYFCFILALYVVFLCFLLIIVIIQNICLYNKKDSFLQKAKWVFKKGFLQDIRHDLWEILICLLTAVWSYQVELFMQQEILIKRQVALKKEWPAS